MSIIDHVVIFRILEQMEAAQETYSRLYHCAGQHRVVEVQAERQSGVGSVIPD